MEMKNETEKDGLSEDKSKGVPTMETREASNNDTDTIAQVENEDIPSVSDNKKQVTRYSQLRKTLMKRGIWPKKEQTTMIDSLVTPLLRIGYGEAGDLLEDLLKLSNAEIQEELTRQSPIGRETNQATKVGIPDNQEKEASTDNTPPSLPTLPSSTEETKLDEDTSLLTTANSPPLREHEASVTTIDQDLDHKHTEQDQETTTLLGIEPFTPNKDRPPEAQTPERTQRPTEVKQSNSKGVRNIKNYFPPTPLSIENDLGQ